MPPPFSSSREPESADVDETHWSSMASGSSDPYSKENEEHKSLLGQRGPSRLSLHDVNLDMSDLGSPRRATDEEEHQGLAGFLKRFKASVYGRILLISCKVVGLTLFCFLLAQEVINMFSSKPPEVVQRQPDPVCSSKLWSNGHWVKRNSTSMPLQPPINSIAEAMRVSNFPASYCSSNRLPLTNTAIPRLENNTAPYWDWRYQVSSYYWRSGCEAAGIPPKPQPTPENLLERFVNEGGWMFIGDSLSAQWFMSLSCYLAPYVRATPYWTTEVPWNATQHLYLDPESPFVRQMRLPSDFDLNTTPLVSILRSGLLISKSQIKDLVVKNHLITDEDPMFGDEKVFDMHPDEYIEDFLNPKLRYTRLVASSGAHYTQALFQGRPLHQVADIFHYSFEHWAQLMIKVLKDPRAKNKKILYRTATAGHHDCRNEGKGGPWNEEKVLETPVWNWQTIPLFNKIADAVMTFLNYPRFELISIDRPAMLRPDGHILIDCLHFTVGAGIIEGWTDFVYNYT